MGRAHTFSRRRFLASIGGIGAAALLAACGGTASNTPAPSQAATSAAPSASGAAPAGASAAASQAPAQQAGQLKNVPRNRTLIHGITGTQLTDYNTFNPFLPGIATSTGYPF